MNANIIRAMAGATVDGSVAFPHIISELLAQGVERYQVDYITRTFTFYSAVDGVVTAPIAFEDLPAIATTFDAVALEAAIVDSQQNNQKFRAFSQRAMNAGVTGYVVYLSGQHVVYFGRKGEQHTQWFPGA